MAIHRNNLPFFFLIAAAFVAGFGVANGGENETVLNKKVADWHHISGHGEIYFKPGDTYEHTSRLMRSRTGQHRPATRRDADGRSYYLRENRRVYFDSTSRPEQAARSCSCPYCQPSRPQYPPNYQPNPYPAYPVPVYQPNPYPAPYPYQPQPQPTPFYYPTQPPPAPRPSPYYRPEPYRSPYQPNRSPYGYRTGSDPMSEKKTGERVCSICGRVALGSEIVKTTNTAGDVVEVGCRHCLNVGKAEREKPTAK